jgi:ABC-2 type transport system ATP-binding protein
MAPTILANRLTKRYGGVTALDALDLEIETGEVFGYLGPNGAGKSTTIALLLGLIRPTSGEARVLGLDVRRDAPAIHRRLAYVPSEGNLWPALTGAEVLNFLASIHTSVDNAYRDELIQRFAFTPDKKVRSLSHGNRQKILLIAAFASRAEVLLLDEPTTGLDPLMEQVFRDCVHQAHNRGQTVLLSSHVLSEVEAVCDRVAMLRAGRIIETGHLGVLRDMAAIRVSVRFGSETPDLSRVPGVLNVVVDGNSVECDVSGSMEPLLRALSDVAVERLTTREPSLEELFVAHYGEQPTPAVPVVRT